MEGWTGNPPEEFTLDAPPDYPDLLDLAVGPLAQLKRLKLILKPARTPPVKAIDTLVDLCAHRMPKCADVTLAFGTGWGEIERQYDNSWLYMALAQLPAFSLTVEITPVSPANLSLRRLLAVCLRLPNVKKLTMQFTEEPDIDYDDVWAEFKNAMLEDVTLAEVLRRTRIPAFTISSTEPTTDQNGVVGLLASGLSENPHVTTLSFIGVDVEDIGDFSPASAITHITVRSSCVTTENFYQLARQPALKCLELHSREDDLLPHRVGSRLQLQGLTSLTLSASMIFPEVIAAVCAALPTALTSLVLIGAVRFRAPAITALADAIEARRAAQATPLHTLVFTADLSCTAEMIRLVTVLATEPLITAIFADVVSLKKFVEYDYPPAMLASSQVADALIAVAPSCPRMPCVDLAMFRNSVQDRLIDMLIRQFTLEQARAFLNLPDFFWASNALLEAARGRTRHMIHCLLARGADARATDAEGNTALHLAVERSSSEGPRGSRERRLAVVEALLQGCDRRKRVR
eukprot:m.259951 g.259951  ORF g.259951 m.259951 type:complete len:518 (+) comp23076_c0_seq1:79-1632(+)